MGKEFFILNRVYLRGIQKEDFTEGLFYWANDQEVTYYMVTGLKPSIKEKMEQLYLDTINNDKELVFAIVDKESDKTIGLVGLYQINPQVGSTEYRIIIGNKSFWGKGIGTECTNTLVNYAFRSLNLNKVWLGVNDENIGGVKSYEKSGFVREGMLRQEIYRNNKYYGAVRMSILRSEWATREREKENREENGNR